MSSREAACEMMAKAARAYCSAEALLALNDTEGACNRAYYAMFDAAKAALMQATGPQLPGHKTHSGLITTFSLTFVKNGPIPKEIGKLLKRAEEVRLIADYTGDEIEQKVAEEVVAQAGEFLRVIQEIIFSAE